MKPAPKACGFDSRHTPKFIPDSSNGRKTGSEPENGSSILSSGTINTMEDVTVGTLTRLENGDSRNGSKGSIPLSSARIIWVVKFKNPIKLLMKNDLKEVFEYVINKYGKDYIKLYEDKNSAGNNVK